MGTSARNLYSSDVEVDHKAQRARTKGGLCCSSGHLNVQSDSGEQRFVVGVNPVSVQGLETLSCSQSRTFSRPASEALGQPETKRADPAVVSLDLNHDSRFS